NGIHQAKTRGNHADRPDQTGLIGINFVCSSSHIIGTGRSHIRNHGVEFDIRILSTQTLDLIVNVTGLYRAAARTVNSQHHPFYIGRFKCIAKPRHDIIGTGRLVLGNNSANIHQSSMRLRNSRDTTTHTAKSHHQNNKEIGKGQQLEKNTPTARTPLLLSGAGYHLFDQLPLLAGWLGWRSTSRLVIHRKPLLSVIPTFYPGAHQPPVAEPALLPRANNAWNQYKL